MSVVISNLVNLMTADLGVILQTKTDSETVGLISRSKSGKYQLM